MLRHSPLWVLVFCVAAFPASCSNKDDSGRNPYVPVDGDDDIDIGGMGGTTDSQGTTCREFAGLADCGLEGLRASRAPVNILLVLDKSGSMDQPPEPNSPTTLWEAARTALATALDEANSAIAFGLDLFPYRTTGSIPLNCHPNCCDLPSDDAVIVPVAEGAANRQRIVEVLSRTAPGGGTPTAAALSRAFEYYDSGEGRDLKGGRFVLLTTDGGPNCNGDIDCTFESCTINIDQQCRADDVSTDDVNCCATNKAGCLDDDGTAAEIRRLRNIGVDTFVVGLAGSERYAAQLDLFAEEGGRALADSAQKYFKVDAEGSAAGLTDVLTSITEQLVQSCDVQLDEGSPDINMLNVAVDCEVVPLGAPPETGGLGGNGGEMPSPSVMSSWYLDTSTEPPTARLIGDICDKIQNTGVERIDILRGCPAIR